MKANELAIGDWVNFLIEVEGGDTEYGPENEIYQPMQVDSVSSLDEVSSAFFGVTNDVAQLQPIPLTAEILKKNGFIIKEKWAQIGNFGDSPLIMWHFADDPILGDYKTELEVHQNDTGKVHIHVPCEYVHELQHVLRLCNIDKEIEL